MIQDQPLAVSQNRKRGLGRNRMLRSLLLSFLLVCLGCSLLVAQDAGEFASGPAKGKFIPKALNCYNVTGPSKGKYHCIVCDFGLTPSAIIFAKEPAKDKGAPLNDLLKQLDEIVDEFEYRGFSAAVIFLSPDARDSTNNTAVVKPADLIKEAVNRQELVKRIGERAETLKLKKVILGYYLPEGPEGFKLNPKADATVLFYERMKIHDVWAFPADGLQEKHVAQITKRIRDELTLRKKPAEEK
jgi:hypothetical protein